jgi:hypothetical protein
MPGAGCVEGACGGATGAVDVEGLRGRETTGPAGARTACCLPGAVAADCEDVELAGVDAAAGVPAELAWLP